MKIIKTLIGILFLCFSTTVFSQATATFNASVTIIQPIGITTTSDLSFANVAAKNGGEVTLNPNNTRVATGDLELAEGGNASAASFEIVGEPGYTYDVTLPKETYILSNGTESIEIKNFTSDFSNEVALVGGSHKINIGATIKINPNQTPGKYISTGEFQVAVNYN